MNTRSVTEKDKRQETVGAKPVKAPPKKQVDVLCHCPQKCDTRVPKNVRQWFFTQFQSVDDRTRQNAWLQSQIEMRSIYKRMCIPEENGAAKLQRRVSCKYRVPTNIPLRLFPTMCGKVNTVEVCMKAFMNVYGVTEKRIRLQRERMISELRKETNDDVALELASLDALPAASIDTVDSFFLNQLWKPEYIAVKEKPTAVQKQAQPQHEKTDAEQTDDSDNRLDNDNSSNSVTI